MLLHSMAIIVLDDTQLLATIRLLYLARAVITAFISPHLIVTLNSIMILRGGGPDMCGLPNPVLLCTC